MNRGENITKWAIAIIVMFGLITAFFVLQWAAVLKIFLIFLAISLIGAVLLQSGKGGGLAAIGGLSDQSMMGTQTGTFLGKVTYLLGGAVVVAIILLSKTTPDHIVQMPMSVNESTMPFPNGQGPGAPTDTGKVEDASMGMSEVDSSGTMNMAAPATGETNQSKPDTEKSGH